LTTKSSTEGAKRMAYRLLLIPAAVSLALTATSLSYNTFFDQMVGATQTSTGASPLDLFVIGACLIVLLIGLLDHTKVMYSYLLAALLYLPSALGLSKIDWLAALGFEGGMSTFASELSGTALLVIGVVVLACMTLHRTTERQISIRAELCLIGALKNEVDRAVDRMFISSIILIIAVGAITFATWLMIENMLDDLGELIGSSPGIAVLVGLIASMLLVAAIAFLMRAEGHLSIGDE
jgi:hypothetical protein